ncbi:MAG: hypothetical protein KC505_00670 [Myxococcales bacterium]|nr:hypothetical protein [Myxococcales bacterium]USN51462.1 MAG: hypothetical protein H6731_03375 [Myxococcales bacterium]
MIKASIFSLIFAATSLLASTANTEYNYYQSGGEGRTYHDGDYIKFTLSFNAECFEDRTEASNYVVNNLNHFRDWIELKSQKISYTINPISLSQQNHSWDRERPCDNKYFAAQKLTLTLEKGDEANALDNETVQNFYQELQQAIWPLHTEGDENNLNHVTSGIDNIYKGVYEHTADNMRRIARRVAQKKATDDFIDFLGDDFQGQWRLQKVDFIQRGYSDFTSKSVVPAAAPIAENHEIFIPATLKLEPLSVEVSGDFYFVYNL